MEKTHIWLSQYEWQIFTKFLEIWRSYLRQPVTTLICEDGGLPVVNLEILLSRNVIQHRQGKDWLWSPALDVNVGVMIAGGDIDTQEENE